MAKVRTRYKVFLKTGYDRIKYRTKTISLELPTNEHGNILHKTLTEALRDHLEKTAPEEVSALLLLNFEILRPA